ncbi:MAG TPA: single-stranded DNA-binding protein [Actinomycetaceae bacterium]|nr:single-stranded DNA-binding protein [Actinomycetaceae bacterium]
MSDVNAITVTGHVGTNPELQVTPTGREVTRFRLAVNAGYRGPDGQWVERDPQWFSIKVWGEHRARNVADSVRKGMPVVVQGALSVDRWEGQDGERFDSVITARSVAVPIEHGRVTYARVVREAANGAGAPEDADAQAGGGGAQASGAAPSAVQVPQAPDSVEPAEPDPWERAEQAG